MFTKSPFPQRTPRVVSSERMDSMPKWALKSDMWLQVLDLAFTDCETLVKFLEFWALVCNLWHGDKKTDPTQLLGQIGYFIIMGNFTWYIIYKSKIKVKQYLSSTDIRAKDAAVTKQ